MNASVELDTTDLRIAMARLEARLPAITGSTGLEAAAAAADQTRNALPRRTGELASSVRSEQVSSGATITIGADYAGWIIYGGTRGRPFVSDGRYLGPALAGADRDYARRAEAALSAEARRL